MIFCPKSSCFLLFLSVFCDITWPHLLKGTSTSKWPNETWEFVGVGEVWNNMLSFLGVSWRVPGYPSVIYEGWTSLGVNNCCKMEKEVTMSQKTRNLGEFVNIVLADTYPKKPLFFQGFQSLNKQMLWDDGSRIFFSYTQIFGFVWKTRAHTKHQDRLLQSCCGCWSWRFTLGHLAEGIWNSRTFSHFQCTICEAGAHSIWEVLAR